MSWVGCQKHVRGVGQESDLRAVVESDPILALDAKGRLDLGDPYHLWYN
jgi:hypothetical protein